MSTKQKAHCTWLCPCMSPQTARWVFSPSFLSGTSLKQIINIRSKYNLQISFSDASVSATSKLGPGPGCQNWYESASCCGLFCHKVTKYEAIHAHFVTHQRVTNHAAIVPFNLDIRYIVCVCVCVCVCERERQNQTEHTREWEFKLKPEHLIFTRIVV